MGKARDWGDVGAEGGPGAIRKEGDDPATDIPLGNGHAYLTEEKLRTREPLEVNSEAAKGSFTDSPISNGHANNPHPTIDLDQFDAAIERSRAGDGPKSNRRPSEVSIIFANKITPEPIEWLWVNSIAKRKLQLIAGAPGAGKSTIAFSLAATISSGGYWPDKTKASIGTVLIWSSEDSPGDTIVPRLMQMGADLNHIGFVRNTFTAPDRKQPFNPAVDMPALVEKVKQLGGVDLLILDPVVAAIPGSKDSHKNTEVRAGLQPVVDFAEAANCAVIGISHFTKGTSGKDPVEPVTGSLAFGALPRIVWAVAENKSDEAASPRIFVRAKNNNGPSGGGFGFDIVPSKLIDRPDIIATRVKWMVQIEGTAKELLDEAEAKDDDARPGKLDEAKGFLITELSEGERPATEIIEKARKNGIAKRTLDRAANGSDRDPAIVAKRKDPFAGWFWKLK